MLQASFCHHSHTNATVLLTQLCKVSRLMASTIAWKSRQNIPGACCSANNAASTLVSVTAIHFWAFTGLQKVTTDTQHNCLEKENKLSPCGAHSAFFAAQCCCAHQLSADFPLIQVHLCMVAAQACMQYLSTNTVQPYWGHSTFFAAQCCCARQLPANFALI